MVPDESSQTINALLALKEATPTYLMDEPLGISPSLRPTEIYNVPSSKILQRGQTFFDQVYGKVSKRVMGQMDRSGTEDLGLTARLMYGYVLSNTNVLNAAESSFVLLAGLIPQDVSLASSNMRSVNDFRSIHNSKATSKGQSTTVPASTKYERFVKSL